MPTAGLSFLAHQGTQTRGVLTALLGYHAPDSRLGATVFLPRYSPGTAEDICGEFDVDGAYVLADPETHRLHFPFAERGRARRDYPYLSESDPMANRDRFVEQTLRAQVNASRRVLVSPWLIHGVDPTDDYLSANIDFARRSLVHELAEDREMLIGMAVTDSVLVNPNARGRLLDELIELDNQTLYLRTRVASPESFRQYANRDVLAGLRESVSALVENGINVLLPQVGLSGWLMLPFGALAFGSGINGSLQKFPYPSGGFGQPLEWWFCPSLLGFVLREEVEALAEVDGWIACPCPDCANLVFDGSAPWNKNRAGRHYLTWCTWLANELPNQAAPAAIVRDRLEAARRFWEAAQEAVVLDPRSEPRHLEDWLAVVG